MWKARINLGFETGRKPIHLPIPQSDPPSWAHLFLMNSHGHRWTHTQIDGDAHTTNGWVLCVPLHLADTYTLSQRQHISSPFSLFVRVSSVRFDGTVAPSNTARNLTHTHRAGAEYESILAVVSLLQPFLWERRLAQSGEAWSVEKPFGRRRLSKSLLQNCACNAAFTHRTKWQAAYNLSWSRSSAGMYAC